MKRLILVGLTATFGLTLVNPAPARAIDFGLGLFKRKPKSEPGTQVKAQLNTLRSDMDEQKRLAAAIALREADPRVDAEVIPTLIGSLQRDPSPAVRSQAAETLGRLKPVYQHAGLALETAAQTDPAASVREAAKAALWQYHLAGYRSVPVNPAVVPQTVEPPIAVQRTMPETSSPTGRTGVPLSGTAPLFRPISMGVGKTATFQQTVEPPLARDRVNRVPEPPSPPSSPAVPLPAPIPVPAPISVGASDPEIPPVSAIPTPLPAQREPIISPGSVSPSVPGVPTLTPPPPLGAGPNLPIPNPF